MTALARVAVVMTHCLDVVVTNFIDLTGMGFGATLYMYVKPYI